MLSVSSPVSRGPSVPDRRLGMVNFVSGHVVVRRRASSLGRIGIRKKFAVFYCVLGNVGVQYREIIKDFCHASLLITVNDRWASDTDI